MGLKKGDKINSPELMEEIKSTLTIWHNQKLKAWAKDNGMSIRAAIRYIIIQFLKNTSY
jgi:hypothetical protein